MRPLEGAHGDAWIKYYAFRADRIEFRCYACPGGQQWFFAKDGRQPYNAFTRKFREVRSANSVSVPAVKYEQGELGKKLIHTCVANLWGVPVGPEMFKNGETHRGGVDLLVVDHVTEGQDKWNWRADCLQFLSNVENVIKARQAKERKKISKA